MTVAEFALSIVAFLFLLATGYIGYRLHKKLYTETFLDVATLIIVILGWFSIIIVGIGYVFENIDWNSKLF